MRTAKLRFIGLGVLVGLIPLLGSAPVTAQEPVTYSGVEFPQGDISFADRVISFSRPDDVSDELADPARVLGPPDTDTTSLGNSPEGGCAAPLVVEFVDNYLIDVDGDDLYIFEAGPAVEATSLEISVDGRTWIPIGRIEGSTRGVDIAGFVSAGQRFPFVRLCDFPDGNTSGAPWAGPDIDAIGAIGSVVRPPGEVPPVIADDDGPADPPPPIGEPEPATVSRMTIQAGQRQVVSGGTVWVPVYLLRSDDVANINFEIQYDSNVAVVEGDLVAGNLLGGRLFSGNAGDSGIIRVGFAGTDGVNGTGTVAWITFRAVGRPGDRTELSVTVSTINQPDGTVPGIDRINGAVIITDENGLTPGDCDGNGYLTEYDAFCALQMSVQLRPVQLVLDMNGDGQVTSRDATLILQRVTGRT